MKDRFQNLWKSGQKIVASQAERALERTCLGRIVNALTFLAVILCLGLWIAAFLLLKDQWLATLDKKQLTDLTCLLFFGGLVIAILSGALIGNFLRRIFWKILIRRANRKASRWYR